jgi:hypothetical protein
MKKILVVFILLVIALSACAQATSEPTDSSPVPTATEAVAPPKATEIPTVLSPTPVSGGDYPEVVLKARDALASKLGISVDQITVVNIEPVEWRDGCLGVSNPRMMCTMMITPGYRVILRADGSDYEYHTDSRSAVVLASLQPSVAP